MASAISSVGGVAKSRYTLLIIFQVVLIILYGVFVRYDDTPHKKKVSASMYAMFQDVHVMIFVGFGFLMTFLKKYGYSALGFNWLIGALVVQWSLLCQNFFHLDDENKINVSLLSLLEADIMAAAVLISFGAVLGRTTGPQLMVMATIETAVGCTNLYLMNDVLKIADCGGSIAIHTFGAYFGLAASLATRTRKTSAVADQHRDAQHPLEGSSYSSDITAMIGSVFLWIFWPSFNAALLTSDNEQYRAVVNTYLSLAAATVTAFVVSSMVNHERKFDMVHVQNSTLAGGVAVGSVCNMIVQPFGALTIGMGAGILSVLGYKYLTPKLDSKFGLKDTCGVHNLHGMPGLYSGLMSAIFASLATVELYGNAGLESVFPGMATVPESSDVRTAQTQALYQLLGLLVTIVIAIVSGALTGRLMTLPLFDELSVAERYDDKRHWELPTVGEATNSADNDATKSSTVGVNNSAYEQSVELETAPK